MPDSTSPTTILYALWLAGITAAQVWAYLRRPGTEAARDLAAAKAAWQTERMELQHRVETLALQLEHVPTSVELTELRGAVGTLTSRMESLEGDLGRVLGAVQRIETYLLNRKA